MGFLGGSAGGLAVVALGGRAGGYPPGESFTDAVVGAAKGMDMTGYVLVDWPWFTLCLCPPRLLPKVPVLLLLSVLLLYVLLDPGNDPGHDPGSVVAAGAESPNDCDTAVVALLPLGGTGMGRDCAGCGG